MDVIKQKLSVDCLVLSLVGVAFLLLNLFTFTYCDDYPYAFFLNANGVIEPSHRINSISDILLSQYHHYFYANGRILDNGLVQWFMSLGNKHIFDVCNTLVFMGYVYFLQKVTDRQGWKVTFLIIVLLLGLMRAFGDVFLWLSGSLNALWGGLLNLVFLYELGVASHKALSLKTAWILIPLSLAAGWWQEGFSIGITAALLISICYGWWHKKPWAAVPLMMAAAYIVGTLLLVLSPGTLDRMARDGADGGYLLSHLGENIAYVLRGMRLFWLAILIVMIQHFRHKQNMRNMLRTNGFLLLALGVGMLFLMLLGPVADPRSFFGIETLSLVIILRTIPDIGKSLGIALAVIALIIYLPIVHMSWKNHQTMQAFLQEVRTSGENVFFDLPRYSPTQVHYLGSLLELNHHSFIFKLEAAFYGKECMRVLPKRLYQELYLTSSFINPQNEWRPGEYSTPEMVFSVIPLPADEQLPASDEDKEYVSFPSGNYVLKDKEGIAKKQMGKRKDGKQQKAKQ